MSTAPLPSNEAARIQALYDLEILDTGIEDAFDRITRLAATFMDAPVALISLVDANRQWFKSRVGWDRCDSSRDEAFCAHAILEPDIMVVSDARRDPRFYQNPIVIAEPHIRFYAGAPLVTNEGYALGTLCVLDTKVRELDAREGKALRDLAALTVIGLRVHREISCLATT